MTLEKFERLEGSVNIKDMTQLETLIQTMSIDLIAQGYDDTEVKEFFAAIAGFVVNDVQDNW